MPDQLDPNDEAHGVFPDTAAKPPKPPTAEQMINHAIHDIKFNVAWSMDENRDIICWLCSPGGYRLRRGASMDIHATQRNPDTHAHNLKWATIQWFKANNLPVPVWPDCYRKSGSEQLWCHICRTTCGLYGQEDGEHHDKLHANMERKVMRPNRLIGKAIAGEAKRERKRHVLDEILISRRDDYQGAGEFSPDYRPHFTDPSGEARAKKDQLARFMPDDQRPASDYQRIFGKSYWVTNNKTHDLEQVTDEQLAAWVTHTDPDTGQVTRWRAACETYDLCVGTRRGNDAPDCIGDGCEDTCHINADPEGASHDEQ